MVKVKSSLNLKKKDGGIFFLNCFGLIRSILLKEVIIFILLTYPQCAHLPYNQSITFAFFAIRLSQTKCNMPPLQTIFLYDLLILFSIAPCKVITLDLFFILFGISASFLMALPLKLSILPLSRQRRDYRYFSLMALRA